MKITRKGNKIHLEMYTRQKNKEWEALFDFKVYKNDFEELKEHMIKTLQDFKLDD